MSAFPLTHPTWSDFPNGLRVLIVDTDTQLLALLKSKLEAFHYVVTTFASSGDAVVALQSPSSIFHVALVEATLGEDVDGWKVLENAAHIPVIMMSSTENMAVMMKGLASGAFEFLQKPLSDETLKNIWQPVVRKALCNGELLHPEVPRPVEDSEPSSTMPQPVAGRIMPEPSSELSGNTPSTMNDGQRMVKVKNEQSTDDVEPAGPLMHEEDSSTLVNMKPGLAEAYFLSCERLASPTTPQLDQSGRSTSKEDVSDESPGLQGVSSSKNGLHPACSLLPDHDHALQAKSEPEEVSDGSSCDLCGLLGANMEDNLMDVDDFESLKSEQCSDLQFDEDLELDDSFGDITLNREFVVDGHAFSRLEMAEGLDFSEGLGAGLDCLDDVFGQDNDSVDEEALLLEEVKKAEKNLSQNNSEDSGQHGLIDSLEGSSRVAWHCQGDAELSGKCSKGKRKTKVDWTPELHRRFVQAVEQIGVDKAIPSRILEIMGVQCLTRHNIASHLQKYRSHRKHLLVREAEAASWNQRRNMEPVTWARPRLPTHHHATTAPIQPRPPVPLMAPPLHVWGHPTVDHSQMHMWQKPRLAPPSWRSSDGTLWQPQACIDAWSHAAPFPGMPCYPQPIMRLPLAPMPGVANKAVPLAHGESIIDNVGATVSISGNAKIASCHLPRETVDAAINEVLVNPCTPLPLGLKPPSLESVISELQRQGIRTAPPATL